MDQETFIWEQYPDAEELLLAYLEEACNQSAALTVLRQQLLSLTSTRLFDWIDHFAFGPSKDVESAMRAVGFIDELVAEEYRVLYHPRAQLPAIVLYQSDASRLQGVAIKTESIGQFLLVRGQTAAIEGAPYSGYRRCCIAMENGSGLWVVERRGTRTMTPTYPPPGSLERIMQAREKWLCRPRDWADEEAAVQVAIIRANEMAALVGKDMAAHIVLEVEREYWQSRNRAAQAQKARQDHMGMGWANHDHHTFRSSRKFFSHLVHLFEGLGFTCRERFYSGQEAGWGAQVMENRNSGAVLFLDVDLSPEEVAIDFAHQQLPPRDELGTIGLWCGLHGDSILQAGMHHLEAQFFFDKLRHDLAEEGIGMMEPFSDYDYLKQAFTEGERWPVAPRRVQMLVEEELITKEQAAQFTKEGAVGSHLENLQRRAGFKGFNQKNISYIIKRTDPRVLT